MLEQLNGNCAWTGVSKVSGAAEPKGAGAYVSPPASAAPPLVQVCVMHPTGLRPDRDLARASALSAAALPAPTDHSGIVISSVTGPSRPEVGSPR